MFKDHSAHLPENLSTTYFECICFKSQKDLFLKKPHRHRKLYCDYQKGRGWERQKEVEDGDFPSPSLYVVMERDLAQDGEHTIKYIDNTLQTCTPETYIILLANVTSINSIKNKKERLMETVAL